MLAAELDAKRCGLLLEAWNVIALRSTGVGLRCGEEGQLHERDVAADGLDPHGKLVLRVRLEEVGRNRYPRGGREDLEGPFASSGLIVELDHVPLRAGDRFPA